MNVNASDTRARKFKDILYALVKEEALGSNKFKLIRVLRLMQDVKT